MSKTNLTSYRISVTEASEETPAVQAEPGFQEKVERAFPLMCLMGYITLAAFAYSSSLLLAEDYARRLTGVLPYPIFLQDEKLSQIVRREAEAALGQEHKGLESMNVMGYVKLEGQADPRILSLIPGLSTAPGSSAPHAELWTLVATWLWDEMTRTEDGGIEMKVARQETYQLPKPTEKSELHPSPRVGYTVRADPWGRVIEIKRNGK